MVSIIVEGSRGKSGTAEMIVRALQDRGESVVGKITGKEPAVLYEREKIPIIRKKGFLIDTENREVLKKYGHCTYKIFENQALSAYTMRVMHNLIKPDIIIIPNIRFEHQDRLGETIEEQARSFAVNFKGSKMVITTEKKEEVLLIFMEYCKKYNVRLIVINKEEEFPSVQMLYLTDKLFEMLFEEPLSRKTYQKYYRELKGKVRLGKSEKEKIDFFKGSKVNDVESTLNMFNFIKEGTDKDFCFLCYFRKDRAERTKAFLPYLKNFAGNRRIKRIFVSGHHIHTLPKDSKIQPIGDKDKERVFEFCRQNDLILFTAVNGVNGFMQDVEGRLA